MYHSLTEKSSRRSVIAALSTAALTGGVAHPVVSLGKPQVKAKTVKVIPSLVSLQDGSVSAKANEIIETLGYFNPGDGGRACYEIVNSLDGEFGESITVNLYAKLLSTEYVNYKMFGAQGDGVSDDGEAILKAHSYANKKKIPVVNPSGEFWIKKTKRIPIQTNTFWGNTIFHIDESFNLPREPHFEILPDEEGKAIVLDQKTKASLVEKLKPGTKFIPELEAYRNCLVVVSDEEDRIGRRYGPDYNPRGWAREEFFYVEEHGRIIGDIAWTFQNYTHLMAYPCGYGYLTLEGGTFLMSGDNPGVLGGPYHQNGILIRRSRTIIRNQWVGLEPGRADISLTPRSGFYTFSHVYDILLENVRLIPWEKIRKEPEKTLKAGTYGIGGARVLCGTFRNLTAEGSPIHWGVFGTNLFKNFRIENCRLNRVDVHFHGWNITIKDSEIGQKGLTLTGGGELIIENTRVFNNVFLNFRSDYGAKWDGPIRILNSRVIAQGRGNVSLMTMTPGDFDYKYPVVFGKQILVQDFIFVSEEKWNESTYSLIRFPKFSVAKEGGRLVFPSRIEFTNIQVDGRERGVSLFELPDVSSFDLREKKGGLLYGRFQPNSSWKFSNVQLDSDSLGLSLDRTQEFADDKALFPAITFTDCQGVSVDLGNSMASVDLRNSTVNAFSTGDNFQGKILFDNCSILIGADSSKQPVGFTIRTKKGVSFSNCEINFAGEGSPSLKLLDRIEFIKINGPLEFNHTNTQLGPNILKALADAGIQLNSDFVRRLKSHHELESI